MFVGLVAKSFDAGKRFGWTNHTKDTALAVRGVDLPNGQCVKSHFPCVLRHQTALRRAF